jgi:hypothetical protein
MTACCTQLYQIFLSLDKQNVIYQSVYTLHRAMACLAITLGGIAVGLTSTCQEIEVKDHLASLWTTCG